MQIREQGKPCSATVHAYTSYQQSVYVRFGRLARFDMSLLVYGKRNFVITVIVQ